MPGISVRVFLLYGDAALIDKESPNALNGVACVNEGPLSSSNVRLRNSESEPLPTKAMVDRVDQNVKFEPRSEDKIATRLRHETDWAPVVIGTKARTFSRDWNDASLFRL